MDIGRNSFQEDTYILFFFNRGVFNNGIVNRKGPNKHYVQKSTLL